MNYYHMTSLNRLNSISKNGLTPRNEDNSKLINDKKTKVFFSVGFTGAVALYVDFDIVYRDIKTKKVKLNDKELERKVMNSKDLSDYLKEGVYLKFDGSNIKNERNFENGCTDKIINPDDISVCILKNKKDESTIFSRFEIIKYMMAKTKIEEIKFFGANYEDSPDTFEKATINIQNKVRKYYNKHKNEIEKYNNNQYILEYIPIKDFVTKIEMNEKDKMEQEIEELKQEMVKKADLIMTKYDTDGFSSRGELEMKESFMEFDRRLKEIKEKYNKNK